MDFFNFADDSSSSKTATAVATPVTTEAPESDTSLATSDFLILNDEPATEAPHISAFADEETTADVVTFDEPVIASTDTVSAASEATDLFFDPVSEAPESVIDTIESLPVIETVNATREEFAAVVEPKATEAFDLAEVSDTMDLDSTITATIAKIQENVKRDEAKIKALLDEKADLIAQSERILAEAKAKEEETQKIEADSKRAQKVIAMLTKEIPA